MRMRGIYPLKIDESDAAISATVLGLVSIRKRKVDGYVQWALSKEILPNDTPYFLVESDRESQLYITDSTNIYFIDFSDRDEVLNNTDDELFRYEGWIGNFRLYLVFGKFTIDADTAAAINRAIGRFKLEDYL